MIRDEFIKTAATDVDPIRYHGPEMTAPVKISGINYSDADVNIMGKKSKMLKSVEKDAFKSGLKYGIPAAIAAGVPTGVYIGKDRGLGKGLLAGGIYAGLAGSLGYMLAQQQHLHEEMPTIQRLKDDSRDNLSRIAYRNYMEAGKDIDKMPIPKFDGDEESVRKANIHWWKEIEKNDLQERYKDFIKNNV